MGADRALIVVGLQTLLMTGVRSFGVQSSVAQQTQRVLATAASLDYVLMLATGSAGTPIPPEDAQQAVRAGFERAVDDGLDLLRAIVRIDDRDARAFVREALGTVRAAMDAEALGGDARNFAMIVLATESGV